MKIVVRSNKTIEILNSLYPVEKWGWDKICNLVPFHNSVERVMQYLA